MISREQMVTQSVQTFVDAALQDRGYAGAYEFVDTWEDVKRDGLGGKTVIASGVDFDDEGEQAEMGSDLKRRLYTLQFIVFGTTETFARNLAHIIKFAIDKDGTIPLLDIEQDPPVEIDRLVVTGVSAERVDVADPEPWQEHVWTCTARVEDEYHARLV